MTTEDVRCLRSDVGRSRIEAGKEQGRDTTMCGDPKAWFPMRVTYQREMKVKAELDRLGIENFVPMTYRVVDADTDNPRRELVPAISNLIFVRSTQERLSELKQSNEVLEPLRYMMDHTTSCEHAPSPSSPPCSSGSSLLTNLSLGPGPSTKFFSARDRYLSDLVLGSGMDEELANALLDDMDFFNNKVKCRKIEGLMPKLMKMVEEEMKSFSQRGNR